MLESEAHMRAKRRAAELGLPLAAYIRRLVDADTQRSPQSVDRSAIIGMFASGGANVARDKKDMVAAAFAPTDVDAAPRRRGTRTR